MTREELDEAIQQAAHLGVQMVGHDKALSAALMAHCKCSTELFQLITGMKQRCEDADTAPVLPLTDEVLMVMNNAVGSMALVAAIMAIREDSDVNADTSACGNMN